MPRGARARALELMRESERLEKELWALTERLTVFTEVLQAELAAKAQAQAQANGSGDHVATDD
jgi:hypothetical protein